jgi:D-alanyl-D-alanine dipeptidase
VASIAGWQQVPIRECGESLVSVTGDRVVVRSAYKALRYTCTLSEIFLREDVAARVCAAAALLPSELTLVLWDGWRPVELQRELYGTYRDEIAANTGLTGEALETETQRFVSLPSTDPAKPSPHLSGGAIDLTLGDELGIPLDLGGEFDELRALMSRLLRDSDRPGGPALPGTAASTSLRDGASWIHELPGGMVAL